MTDANPSAGNGRDDLIVHNVPTVQVHAAPPQEADLNKVQEALTLSQGRLLAVVDWHMNRVKWYRDLIQNLEDLKGLIAGGR